MKRFRIACAAVLAAIMMFAACAAESLPESSEVFSLEFAKEALALCGVGSESSARSTMRAAGYEALVLKNYDKAADDVSHTCAFVIGKKTVEYGGEERTLLAVVIRGTSGAEWYSNFDVAPSRDENTVFAENFMLAAEDVFAALKPCIEAEERPLILATGHSRGAAAANLLGVLLDAAYGQENVFVYTFATPNTVRGEMAEREYGNIFNVVHRCDLVTYLPMSSMGYSRPGTDVYLEGPAEDLASVEKVVDTLCALATDLNSYYNVRHSLNSAGESEDGMTPYEIMQMLSAGFTGGASSAQAGSGMGGMSGMSMMKSDYAALFTLLAKARTPEGARIFTYHMPEQYKKGLDALGSD